MVLDSLLATVQMPGGIPVATLAIGKPGAVNAALFAVSIWRIVVQTSRKTPPFPRSPGEKIRATVLV
jgi:phosphoribosylcarboxyaminoimidazole (NCAIR) mutase